MKVLFNKTTEADYTNKLLDVLLLVVADEQVHVTCDLESFIDALLKYHIEMPIVVTCINNAVDVSEIKGLSDILDGLFLIVVADGNSKDFLLSCRRLYPRLLISKEEDFNVIAAVIKKRLTKLGQEAGTTGFGSEVDKLY